MDANAPLIVEPVTLTGRRVRLEPMRREHLDGFCEAGLFPEIWKWNPAAVNDRDEMRAYIELALKWQADGTALPFALVDLASGKIIGSTRLANIDKANRHAEIGWTWITPDKQRGYANTEMKFLLLRHCFETLGCLRVELKTDALNAKSRAAIVRLGAKEEGTFRSHVICWDGRVRDTVWFSVIAAEWPRVKAGLEAKLAA